MASFSDAIKAKLAGRIVRRDPLVFFDFASGPVRLWNGAGDLDTGGYIWKGIRGFGRIGGLRNAINGQAPKTTLTLAAVNADIVAKAYGEETEYYMRPVTIFLQFFDEQTRQPLDQPQARRLALMENLEFNKALNAKKDGWLQTLTLTAETILSGRSDPVRGTWNDANQQLVYPGDRGLERIPELQQHLRKWPYGS